MACADSSEYLLGLNRLDACDDECIVGLSDGVGQVDGPGGILEDEALEAESGAVDGGEADAEVVGETTEEEPLEAALAKISGETGRSEMVVFEEGGVGVDVATEAFTQDQLGVWNVEGRMKGRAGSILQAVFRPERLWAVSRLDGIERLFAGVGGGERDVCGGVPVLSEDHVIEFLREGVDRRDDLIAAGYFKGATGAEVVLNIDDEQSIVGLRCDHHGSLILPLEARGRGVWAI